MDPLTDDRDSSVLGRTPQFTHVHQDNNAQWKYWDTACDGIVAAIARGINDHSARYQIEKEVDMARIPVRA